MKIYGNPGEKLGIVLSYFLFFAMCKKIEKGFLKGWWNESGANSEKKTFINF